MSKNPVQVHKIIPMEETPKRKYKKGSSYDGVIEAFIKSEHTLAKIEMTKRNSSELLDGTYLAGRLMKRIRERIATGGEKELKALSNDEGIPVRGKTVNGEAYLTYEPAPKKKTKTTE